jgi:hypothetical protein
LLITKIHDLSAIEYRYFASAKEFRATITNFFEVTWDQIAQSMIDRINDNFSCSEKIQHFSVIGYIPTPQMITVFLDGQTLTIIHFLARNLWGPRYTPFVFYAFSLNMMRLCDMASQNIKYQLDSCWKNAINTSKGQKITTRN